MIPLFPLKVSSLMLAALFRSVVDDDSTLYGLLSQAFV